MIRNSLPEIASLPTDDANNGDLAFRSSHEQRSLFKRTHPHPDRSKISDRVPRAAGRHSHPSRRKALFPFRGRSLIYLAMLLAVFGFAFASMVLQSSITSVFRPGERGRSLIPGLKFGSSLKFVPLRRFDEDGLLDRLRVEAGVAIRPSTIALVLGNLRRNPESLMLFTVMKHLQNLGYRIKLYAVEDGEARTMWGKLGGQISILNQERYVHLDWSLFEGVIAGSLQTVEVISSLMQEPFCSVPLVWLVQEDTLARRLNYYNDMGWEHLNSQWKSAFSRADAVVFPEYSLSMLYSVLDSGNFFVIPGSPVDVWASESYMKTHSKHALRESSGYSTDDLLVLVVGSSFFYNELSWDYAVAMHTIGPLLVKYAKKKDVGGSLRFIFLCGNSTDGYNDALQELAVHLRLIPGSIRHYGMNADVNGVLLMSDIVLYGTSQDEQSFPSLLTRALSFGIPIIAPDLPVIKNYVRDGVHGMIFSRHNPDDLLRAFSLLVSRDGILSELAKAVGSSGKLLAKNLQASDCIKGFARLMENVLNFQSDTLLPSSITSEQDTWEWNFVGEILEEKSVDMMSFDERATKVDRSRIIYALEKDHLDLGITDPMNMSEYNGELEQDLLNAEDWDGIAEIESFEDLERLEMDQIDERMEKEPGNWDEIYRNARKSEKVKFEANERDEGDLERTGQPVCIYEIYEGAGAWPFLHHGSLYRGLSLVTRTRRLSSDDVDAFTRLSFLNESHYRNLLCEMGGMFSIAYKVDDIHMRPWIGFQSWRSSSRKVSLSSRAERALEETIQQQTKGDVVYFWARLEMDSGLTRGSKPLPFWSMCDILNGGQCRSTFKNAFRRMYALPPVKDALPPMPDDGGYWSALHGWVMPTPSFLEFIMFSRMFVDSIDALHSNKTETAHCLLGSSELERKHCYCRILELLVNVWAYHSARRMVYIDPQTGLLEEHHPVQQRKGSMWAKYFNITLLKSMDEDLAEAADDGDLERENWLWPLTGEVHWPGVYEKQREEKYRLKMDKKRKVKEKLIDRFQHGYKQKTLGG